MLPELDKELAEQYGSYASYATVADPILIDTYGDSPADEVDRLLDIFVKPESYVLDVGCGAGQTLCRLAPKVKAIWGFDQNTELLAATRQRVEHLALANVTLVAGNVALAEDVAQLPDNTFDVVLSRRGPDVNEDLIPKLQPEAVVIQELYQDPLGLKEIFGRQPFLPPVGSDRHPLIYHYRWLGLLPISVKEYFYEQYFRDVDHLASYLSKEAMLSHWRMPDAPYDETRDQAALALYGRYNQTPKGIRLMSHRTVYLFRRTAVQHYPAIPEAQPLY
jgi:SAM-dependent methyltransferase